MAVGPGMLRFLQAINVKGVAMIVAVVVVAASAAVGSGHLLAHAQRPNADLVDVEPSATPPAVSPTSQPEPTPSAVARSPQPEPAPTPTVPPSTGRILRATFFSAAMQEQRAYETYLPPSYDQALDRSYPVLYLLHGDYGTVNDWASLGLQQKMDQAIGSGGPEFIVVMPDGSGHYNDLTDWANRWDGSDRVEDQVLELISVVDQNYRTEPDRSDRFIGGLSSGGFGALNIALHHPELFSTAMSFSGFTAADDPEADPGVFGSNPGYLRANSPSVLVTSQPGASDVYYVLSGGQGDQYFRTRMQQFSAELDTLSIRHEFHVVPGGHDGIAWDAGLDFGLAHLAAQIQAENQP